MASKRKTPTREKPPASTASSRFTILLEAIEQRNRATIDAVFSTSNELRREFNEKFERLDHRMAALEVVVRQHTSILEQHGERLGSLEKSVVALQLDVRGLQKDVGDLRQDVTALQKDVGDLRQDVTALRKDVVTLQHGVRHLTDVVEAKADKLRVDRLEERVTVMEGRLDA